MAADLWLDSSVARSVPKVRELADRAKRKGVRVLVSAQVHLEICRQQRVSTGERFSADLIRSFLQQLDIQVAEVRFDQSTAEAWAALLHTRYPTEEAWRAAKLSTVKACLPAEVRLPAHRVPMTADWLIALAVEQQGSYIAVADKGEEWCGLRTRTPRCALSYEEALSWLDTQPDPGPPSA